MQLCVIYREYRVSCDTVIKITIILQHIMPYTEKKAKEIVNFRT